ncbi:MAG: prenyltransferase/squalene oxidase repeat-containing protein [Candidatus Thorarchaeota archaeon]
MSRRRVLRKSLLLACLMFLLARMVGFSVSVDNSTSVKMIAQSQNRSGSQYSPSSAWEYTPYRYADPVYDTNTGRFINMTKNVEENNAVSVDQIFFRLGTLKMLDPSLSTLSPSVKDYWISQVLSFQRTSGGFGDWVGDRSSVLATQKALQILRWLGYAGLDTALVSAYLDRLQNSITDGYNSHLLDTDSDVHSTYHAVKSYQLINSSPSNPSAVSDYFRRAQNPDGGFGLQTNSVKGIYWTSTATVTQDAILGLSVLGQNASNPSAALSFLQGLQLVSSGGFVNEISPILTTSGSYSASALEAIYSLNGTPASITSVTNYLYSLETVEGGFRLKPSSVDRSLIGTYYCVLGLYILGQAPANATSTLNYVLSPPHSDGYGGAPGETPSLRETFDAVYSQVLMGNYPPNVQGIIDFVASYRNPDGGYGLSGSYVESTLRAIEIYNLIGASFSNVSDTISYLKSLQQPNGGFVKYRGETISYVVSTYRAVRALSLLQSQPENLNGAIAFLREAQNDDGGFGGYSGDSSDVTSTYRAVNALSILGASPSDVTSVISFLRNSQNPDGGFRRGQSDTSLPKNVSNIIFTYSALRALSILDSYPLDVRGAYNYTNMVQNFDGGYAEHPGFTSNIAYTFVSLYILRHFHEFSGFRIIIPNDFDSERFQYYFVRIDILGRMGGLEYSITNTNSSNVMMRGTLQSEGPVILNVANLENGTYVLSVYARDPTGAEILTEVSLFIGLRPPLLVYFGLIAGISFLALASHRYRKRARSK